MHIYSYGREENVIVFVKNACVNSEEFTYHNYDKVNHDKF